MRYTLATGEPVFTGFMRTRPSSTFWAWFYAILYFLQVGWPAWAATAAGAIFFLFARRLAGRGGRDRRSTSSASRRFSPASRCCSVGRRIERTLELLNWILVVAHPRRLPRAGALVRAGTHLARGGRAGLAGFDAARGTFELLPGRAPTSSCSARSSPTRAPAAWSTSRSSNWARDKGYGMGERAGYIPAAVGGQQGQSRAHRLHRSRPTPRRCARWRGWWRIVRADQWGVFFAGALLGMVLPALLYVTFLPRGTDIRGLGISAALASSDRRAASGAAARRRRSRSSAPGCCSRRSSTTSRAWCARSPTSCGPAAAACAPGAAATCARSTTACWRSVVLWGIIALRLAQPIVLLQIGANVAGVVFIIASLHLLYVNTRLLPRARAPADVAARGARGDGALLRVLRHALVQQPLEKLKKRIRAVTSCTPKQEGAVYSRLLTRRQALLTP